MGVILGAVGSLWAPVRGYEYAVVAGCVFCVVAAIAASRALLRLVLLECRDVDLQFCTLDTG